MKSMKSKKELLLSAGLILTATLGLTGCSSNTVTPAPETNTGETVEVETDTTTETSKPSIETENESNETSKDKDASNKEEITVSNHPFGAIKTTVNSSEEGAKLYKETYKVSPRKVGELSVSQDLLTEENFLSFYHEQVKNSDYDIVNLKLNDIFGIVFIGTDGLFGVNRIGVDFMRTSSETPLALFINGMILADNSIVFAGFENEESYTHKNILGSTYLFDKEAHAWLLMEQMTEEISQKVEHNSTPHPFGDIQPWSGHPEVKDDAKGGLLDLTSYEGKITKQDILNFYHQEIKDGEYEFVQIHLPSNPEDEYSIPVILLFIGNSGLFSFNPAIPGGIVDGEMSTMVKFSINGAILANDTVIYGGVDPFMGVLDGGSRTFITPYMNEKIVHEHVPSFDPVYPYTE